MRRNWAEVVFRVVFVISVITVIIHLIIFKDLSAALIFAGKFVVAPSLVGGLLVWAVRWIIRGSEAPKPKPSNWKEFGKRLAEVIVFLGIGIVLIVSLEKFEDPAHALFLTGAVVISGWIVWWIFSGLNKPKDDKYDEHNK